MKYVSRRKQKGVVLLWALGILLVLTIISVSSVKVSNVNTMVSGNSLASMMVYQGAESTLSKVANTNYVKEAAENIPSKMKQIAAADLPNESVSGGSLSSTANVAFIDYTPCPAASGLAMSTSASASAGGVTCQLYGFEVESRLRGTGAKKQHNLGVAIFVPPLNAVSSQ
jgi:Tfp pilus assembly protein PilX